VETSVTFPGLTAIVPSARRFVRGVRPGRPVPGNRPCLRSDLAGSAVLTGRPYSTAWVPNPLLWYVSGGSAAVSAISARPMTTT
jgi:hypothetical protein